jgi:hypothetical protein
MNSKPRYKIISLAKLKLDSDNPRLPKSMHGRPEEEILEYMLLDASLIELMLAIGKNDFFPGEQLLVIKDDNDTYKVVEGNRRLSALKLLNKPELATVQKSKISQVLEETTFRPTEVPSLIFDSEEEIHKYLGYRHITGIKEWKLLEKARYLYNLWISIFYNLSINIAAKEIAKSIGSRQEYVKRILIGYEIYKLIEDEKFYRIKDLDDTSFYFNYIADSLNKPNISNFLGIDLSDIKDNYTSSIILENLKKWTHWLFEKNSQNKTRLIGDSHDLTALNAILGNEEAKIAFDRGATLQQAIELTGELNSQFITAIKSSLQTLETADRMVLKVATNLDEVFDDLKEIKSITNKIVRTMQQKEDESDRF